jgi:hypothetical protein
MEYFNLNLSILKDCEFVETIHVGDKDLYEVLISSFNFGKKKILYDIWNLIDELYESIPSI